MKFRDTFATALRSLLTNKLRSSLTMLGIIIGVAAVIGLMSIGRGVQAQITSTFEELGANSIYVLPYTPGGAGGFGSAVTSPKLSVDDAEAIEELAEFTPITGVTPVSTDYAEVIAGSESIYTGINGTTPEFQNAVNYNLASGQFISERNVNSRDTVVVLGATTAEDLFGFDDPVGQTLKINGRRFDVIGVLEAKGGAFGGVSPDELVVVPISTFHSRLFTLRTASGEDGVGTIVVQVTNSESIDMVIYQIEDVLRERHKLDFDDDDDFTVVSQEQILETFQQILGVFTVFLGSIAGISLLVGGIGIMNIMLVSVTERTREIGLRKALGAKRRDILRQFLFEAAMISLVGSGIGIVGGFIMSRFISSLNIGGGDPIIPVVSPDIIALAIGVAILIGIASGIYPALRAARLNPIDALHYG